MPDKIVTNWASEAGARVRCSWVVAGRLQQVTEEITMNLWASMQLTLNWMMKSIVVVQVAGHQTDYLNATSWSN